MTDDRYNDVRAQILEVLAQIDAEFIRARQPWVARLLAMERARPRSILLTAEERAALDSAFWHSVEVIDDGAADHQSSKQEG